ncbi:MAG: hypothetical protein RDV48_17850 [Candidatus Eremiobacteraeota bacterium]|nr:hypothetical protein [Candidatus Eremiobacteraeota bacterium]
MMRWSLGLVLLTGVILCLSGCFPSAVSVGPDGRIALPRGEGIFLMDCEKGKALQIYDSSEGGPPSWVQWSPKGDRLLYVVSNEIFLIAPDGKGIKSLYKAPNTMGYCTWSPDGSSISVSELVTSLNLNIDEKEPKKEAEKEGGETIPRLTVIDARTGEKKLEKDNMALIHHFMPDGKSLVAFNLQEKEKDTGAYRGELVKIAIPGGDVTSLAKAVNMEWLDVAPSGEAVYLVARAPSRDAPPGKESSSQSLYRYDFTSKGFTSLFSNASGFVAVSPDSSRLIAVRKADGGAELVVMDPKGGDEKVVAGKVATSAPDMGGGQIIPSWLSNDEILYWRYVTVLAPDGKALMPFIVKADASKTTRALELIERMVTTAAKVKK